MITSGPNLLEFAENERTQEFDDLVTAWVQENEVSPFTDISFTDDESGNVTIDMVDEFHEGVLKVFGGDLDIVLEDYIQALVRSMMTNVSEDDLQKIADDYKAMQDEKETEKDD